jgi:hypothetical protein
MGAYVKNHIVSAGLLRRFTDPHGGLQRVDIGAAFGTASERRRPQTVGYRERFFSDPEVARCAEQRLNLYETVGLQALDRITDTWPLEDEVRYPDRLDIACLVAVHIVRNPAFRLFIAGLQNGTVEDSLRGYGLPAEQEKLFLEHVTSEAFRVDHMLGQIPKMASLIASTHWTLIEFPAPLLALSDQPVTVLPLLPAGFKATVQPHPGSGFAFTEEFRMPVDPRHALLFTWANELDAPEPVAGSDDVAADLNRAGIAQADGEWFHHPDRRPTQLPLTAVRSTECQPLGRLLLPDYGAIPAAESQRRADALECLEQMIEGEVTDHFHVARVAVAA